MITIPDGSVRVDVGSLGCDAAFDFGQLVATAAVQDWLRDGEREAPVLAEQTGGLAINLNAVILALAIRAHATGSDHDSTQGGLRLATGITDCAADGAGQIVTVIGRPPRPNDQHSGSGDGDLGSPATCRIGSLKGAITVPDPDSWSQADADVEQLFKEDEHDTSERLPGALLELSEQRVRPRYPSDRVLAETRADPPLPGSSATKPDRDQMQQLGDDRQRDLEGIAGPLREQQDADFSAARTVAAALGAVYTRYGGVFPLNVTGVVDGPAFYFRLRHQQWRIEVAGPDSPLNDPFTHDDPGALVTAANDELCAPGSTRVDPATAMAVIVAHIRTHLLGANCAHPGAINFCPLCGTNAHTEPATTDESATADHRSEP